MCKTKPVKIIIYFQPGAVLIIGIMSSRIQDLLDKAAAVTVSSEDKMSSISRAERQFGTEREAEKCFGELKGKLFRVERWNADSGLSSFELFDATGKSCERETAKVGDFIKITLAGSGKSDWVKIIDTDNAPDEIILTVQPSYNPTESAPDKSVISHFFTVESTNNFCLERKGATLNFYVIGLDEKSNTRDTNNIIETARNVATANLGHYLGIQKGEWTTFCENFLEVEAEK
ncbi:MAG TPA: hypothetical protein VNI84_18790 [Pyrinomonadaceae bacterium]|nr:hypothetical protein [Pyrinomonadaceae bacterium]